MSELFYATLYDKCTFQCNENGAVQSIYCDVSNIYYNNKYYVFYFVAIFILSFIAGTAKILQANSSLIATELTPKIQEGKD